MAKKNSFYMLYALKMTIRHFDGNEENTAQLLIGSKDAKSGVKVYRSLDSEWVKAIIDSDDDITLEDLQKAEDGTVYDIEDVKLEPGRTFSEPTPTLFQFFKDRNGREIRRSVTNVTGVITESSGLTVDDAVRSTMRFRLTAMDENDEHRYAIPNRKSTQLELLQYWDGGAIRNFDEVLDELANAQDAEDEAEA